VDGVRVRDCGSTNGTFIDGAPVTEAPLLNGQTLRLGDVELLLEYDGTRVSVPELTAPEFQKSYRLDEGVSCVNHPHTVAEFHCTQCHRLFCPECIRDVHRTGGRHYRFCSICGGACQRITFESPQQRQSWLDAVKDALTRPFRHDDKS
jgi:pSer/pThr/pTyr-binding forkhead associated (FHA) protein